jgi:hypothetical protein
MLRVSPDVAADVARLRAEMKMTVAERQTAAALDVMTKRLEQVAKDLGALVRGAEGRLGPGWCLSRRPPPPWSPAWPDATRWSRRWPGSCCSWRHGRRRKRGRDVAGKRVIKTLVAADALVR